MYIALYNIYLKSTKFQATGGKAANKTRKTNYCPHGTYILVEEQ